MLNLKHTHAQTHTKYTENIMVRMGIHKEMIVGDDGWCFLSLLDQFYVLHSTLFDIQQSKGQQTYTTQTRNEIYFRRTGQQDQDAFSDVNFRS